MKVVTFLKNMRFPKSVQRLQVFTFFLFLNFKILIFFA